MNKTAILNARLGGRWRYDKQGVWTDGTRIVKQAKNANPPFYFLCDGERVRPFSFATGAYHRLGKPHAT